MRSELLSLLLSFLFVPAAATAAVWPDLSVPAPSQGGGEADAAVVIGIEKYPFVAQVPGAAQNAEDWHLYLTKTRAIPVSQVKLIRDNEATLEDLREAASWAASAVRPGGTLWFVFIGHGAPHKDGKEGVLIGVDAQQRADSLYSRSLRQSELMDLLSKGGQAASVVVLDACFSGRTAEGKELIKGLQPLIALASPLHGWDRAAVFTAGRSDQFAGPLPGSQRPAFSYLLLGALRGWADHDQDGSVTAAEALSFTQATLQSVLKDRRQTPELLGTPAGPLAGPVREPGPDIGSIVRLVRPKDSSELAFGEVSAVALPAIKIAEVQGGFKEADINVERMLETAMLTQKDPDALPLEKMQYWCGLWGTPEGNPYRGQAASACKEWHAFTDKYQEAELNLLDDYSTLARYLSLKLKTADQKAAAINAFSTAYAPLKDHPAFLAAIQARDSITSGAGAPQLPAMDERGPLARLKNPEMPPELVEQAFGPCSNSWCADQDRCKAGQGSGCETYGNYGVSYSDDRYARRTAFYMLGCLQGTESSCRALRGHAPSAITDTKSMGVTMTALTYGCFFLMDYGSCDYLGQTYGQAKGLVGSDLTSIQSQRVLTLEAACLRGLAKACLPAGNLLRDRTRYSSSPNFREFKRAKLLFAKGCRQKDGESCGALTSLKTSWPDLEASFAKELAEVKRLAEAQKLAADLAEAKPRLEAACSGSGSCMDLKKACARDAKKCAPYAQCFASGLCGMEKHSVFASSLLEKACDAADAAACETLAPRYKAGEGVAQDPAKARLTLTKACQLKSAKACDDLATYASIGQEGEPLDRTRSLGLRRLACDLGKADACSSAAGWLAQGIGTSADKDAALTLARKGCKLDVSFLTCSRGMELGDSWSRRQVAKLCDQDQALAQKWPKECEAARQ
ncbi:MAG: caspase family protein [Elusimicrobia bacterium]|nr:caspase family protein [Elusimicrobiota bacterium]